MNNLRIAITLLVINHITKLHNFVAVLVTDIADTLLAGFASYRRLTGDTWSLVQPKSQINPLAAFWLRGIPKPAASFELLNVEFFHSRMSSGLSQTGHATPTSISHLSN